MAYGLLRTRLIGCCPLLLPVKRQRALSTAVSGAGRGADEPEGYLDRGTERLIILIGTGLAALRMATVVWTNVASTVVLAVFLLTAVTGAIFVRGPERAY